MKLATFLPFLSNSQPISYDFAVIYEFATSNSNTIFTQLGSSHDSESRQYC